VVERAVERLGRRRGAELVGDQDVHERPARAGLASHARTLWGAVRQGDNGRALLQRIPTGDEAVELGDLRRIRSGGGADRVAEFRRAAGLGAWGDVQRLDLLDR